jgi:hypothetical protein
MTDFELPNLLVLEKGGANASFMDLIAFSMPRTTLIRCKYGTTSLSLRVGRLEHPG